MMIQRVVLAIERLWPGKMGDIGLVKII